MVWTSKRITSDRNGNLVKAWQKCTGSIHAKKAIKVQQQPRIMIKNLKKNAWHSQLHDAECLEQQWTGIEWDTKTTRYSEEREKEEEEQAPPADAPEPEASSVAATQPPPTDPKTAAPPQRSGPEAAQRSGPEAAQRSGPVAAQRSDPVASQRSDPVAVQ
ncbi:uncharacterized protein LOC115087234 isoform X2 [Rhinatrema bivittatum]|uniref:uncharacterized protein LOC115087234 isoform X2 n=1 Tax=Rhinatrema bivittatum TaxID=194408 RepID=UPI00112985BF|nr:uncharacterized protein LOC115087234 isoform X2 [Rhinatrema bivittatum]XP_029450021.1 uncharacterized protein LOC115087234 isoform X2 [Rhinatrema bivittatum]